jgi:hypothetical protein
MIRNSRSASARRRTSSRPTTVALFIVGVLIAAAAAVVVYVGLRQPAAVEPEWVNGPKTHAEAAQLLEVETAMLGRLPVSRLLADERRDKAGQSTRPRLDAEVADWDRQIAAQAAKVERARQRKEQLDR